jgi:DNA repair exonuclease SbcCD ATPase subunit
MPGISFSKKVDRLELLNAALKRHLSDVPELAQAQAELQQLIDTAKAAENEQRELRGKLQRASRLRRQMELQSQNLRQRLAEELRGKLGKASQVLPLCGHSPRRGRSRGRRADPAATELTSPFRPIFPSH